MHVLQPSNPEVRKKEKESRDNLTAYDKYFSFFFLFARDDWIHSPFSLYSSRL